MKDEALRLALEALKTCQVDGDGWSGPHYWFDGEKVGKAIAAIKQALAQPEPEPEPVAWLYIEPNNPHLNVHYDDVDVSQFPNDEWFPVYKQSKREWQGLTQEDIFGIADKCGLASVDWTDVMLAVEAKLKEKNT